MVSFGRSCDGGAEPDETSVREEARQEPPPSEHDTVAIHRSVNGVRVMVEPEFAAE
jgi:hypothetical protein